MGYYDGSRMAMWKVARRYTLADNFFMGAFGGSFLNHQYLVCACVPVYPDADALAGEGLDQRASTPTRSGRARARRRRQLAGLRARRRAGFKNDGT